VVGPGASVIMVGRIKGESVGTDVSIVGATVGVDSATGAAVGAATGEVVGAAVSIMLGAIVGSFPLLGEIDGPVVGIVGEQVFLLFFLDEPFIMPPFPFSLLDDPDIIPIIMPPFPLGVEGIHSSFLDECLDIPLPFFLLFGGGEGEGIIVIDGAGVTVEPDEEPLPIIPFLDCRSRR
jgi:hypothetical protein